MVAKKRKLVPFLILVMLEHGRHGSVAWGADGQSFTITTALFAKAIHVQNYELRQHIEWLERNGYVTNVKLSYGFVSGRLKYPRWFSAQLKESA